MTKKIKLSKRTITILVLILAMAASIGFSFIASKPDFYDSTIEILDGKKEEALALSVSATAIATAISAIPNVGEPISDMLVEVASYTILITTVIFLEKFLLTTIGTISFAMLIPVACILGIAFLLCKKELLKNLAVKLAIFGILLAIIIPTSAQITKMIESTHTKTIEAIKTETMQTESEDKGFWEKFKDKTKDLKIQAEQKLNAFIDYIAVLIITTCAIPIGVLAFLLWIIKIIFGVNISMPKPQKAANKLRRKLMDREDEEEDSTEIITL